MERTLLNYTYFIKEACWKGYRVPPHKKTKMKGGRRVPNCKPIKEEEDYFFLDEKSSLWQRKEGKSESGGLNAKGVAAYRRENPGSNLQMAVTEKSPKGKRKKRRLAFCRRMRGMKRKLTSAKTANDPDSRINKALRKWRC